MKIALITVKGKIRGSPPLGLLHIASCLISRKIIDKSNIKIFDTFLDDPLENLLIFKPDIIGFSTVTPLYPLAKEYAEATKKQLKEAKIIIGGCHISSLPESLEEPFDIGVVGEGEETFASLVSLLKKNRNPSPKILKKIDGLVFWDKETKQKVITKRRKLIKNLDKLSHINWSLIPRERVSRYETILVKEKPKSVNLACIYTARGCPYQCAFCAENVVWGQRGVRYFSPRYTAEEIEHLYKKYHIDCIHILDDVFGMTKEQVRALIAQLKKRDLLGRIYFDTLFVRADLIDREFSLLLKKLGVGSVFIGIESGSQPILNFLKNKTLTVPQVKRAISILGEHKIAVSGSFMFFSPGEKMKDLQKTLELAQWFIKQENAFKILFSATTPYPGTKLWEIALHQKIINKEDPGWDEFLMFDTIKGGMPRVFFKNSLTMEQCQRIWQKSTRILLELDKKTKKRAGWKEASQKTKNGNDYLDFFGRMRKRIFRFRHQYFWVLAKLIIRPYNLYYILRDIISLPFSFVKLKLDKKDWS